MNLPEWTNTLYWGNSAGTWFLAFSGILAAVLFSKLTFKILQSLGRKFAAKTETTLDDAIFDAIEEPTSMLIGFLVAFYSIHQLTLPATLMKVISIGYYFSVVFAIAWLVDRVVNSLFEEIVAPIVEKTENDMDDQLLPIARRGVRAIIWAMALVVGVNNAGYDVGALIAGLGIGGLAFALAAQDTVQNLFGGLTIFMDQPFKINDRVKVEGYDGTIVEIGTRSTRLKTLEGRIVTLPNSKFTDQAVENVTSEPTRKVNVGIGLTYDMSAEQVEQALSLLKTIVENQPGIKNNPVAFFDGFGDFALNLKLIYHIEKSASIADTQTAVNLEILRSFAKSGLDMAFPTQTLYHIQQNAENKNKVA